MNRVIATFVPILLIADLGAAYAYRDAADWSIIRLVVAPMICGIFGGVMVIGQLDEDQVKKTVGICLLVLAASHFLLKWDKLACDLLRKIPLLCKMIEDQYAFPNAVSESLACL